MTSLDNRVPPVLCYHRIGGALELGVTRVARNVFARQMHALAQRGWSTLSLGEYTTRLQRGNVASRTELLLTFDDGYASLADDAYPLLADLGFTATTFLVTDYVGALNTWDGRYTRQRVRHLDWDAIEHWRARGFDFGSHTATHARLTWLSDAEASAELVRSRTALIARLGSSAGRAVAYPFGACDRGVERIAEAAGYELGFGGVRGNGGPLGLARVPVYSWDVGTPPWGLRDDSLGALARVAAHAANRCAVGTSVMKLLTTTTGFRSPPPRPSHDILCPRKWSLP
ncbi:MAG TPA: polysaccharide deacetylase family protein [Gemmatimonadales bacterium]|nr:polysaccharide deacetylase family protein [Gemmatimonadales bacterium]